MLTFETQADGVVVVRLGGSRLDAESAGAVRAKLGEILESEPRVLVLDLGSVEFMDSTGLGVIISTLRRLPSRSALRICRSQSSITSFFHLTGMDRILSLFSTEAEAVNAGIGRVV